MLLLKKFKISSLRLLTLAVACVFTMQASADVRTRVLNSPHAGITSAWNLLECGERYKQVWFNGEEIRGIGKTYAELLESFDQAPSGSGCDETDEHSNPLTHSGYFEKSLAAFKVLAMQQPALTGEHLDSANWGLQESFNYLAEARLLKGNDLMINGLRTRFKAADDPNTKSQIEMLHDAVAQMQLGLQSTTPLIVGQGTVLRASGDASPQFPFLVNNTSGPIAPNEFQRYAELLNRYGMAAASEAKYIFYKDNVKDVDNSPYKNFPGPEDLDFNNDRVQNEAGRIEAAARAKKAGSHLYLQSLTLAAVQNEDDFQTNNGYQIKRQVNDIDRLYQDIQSGFNPLLLAGDFVPYQKVENFLQLARARIQDAKEAEQIARSNQRTFETDQTSLASELRSQTTQYVDQLYELTGASTTEYDITTREGREGYLDEAFISAKHQRKGLIGQEVFSLEEANLQFTGLFTQMQNLYQRIQIEQERNQKVETLVMATGEKVSAQQYANTLASCCNVSTGVSTGTSKGTSSGVSHGTSQGSSSGTSEGTSEGTSQGSSQGTSYSLSASSELGSIMGAAFANMTIGYSQGRSQGVTQGTSQGTSKGTSEGTSTGESWGTSSGTSEGQSWGTSSGESRNPNIEKLAQGQSALSMLNALQQAEMDGINSESAIKNILLEMAVLNVSIEQARVAITHQQAQIDNLFDRLERLVANYAVAQEDFAGAYYNNPAYRMEASRAEQAANDTFETALELSYYAAKALEYQWSEKFNNPVLRLDGGMPEPLSVSFDPFMRAESVFSAQFAALYSPSLDDYLDGLQAWDVKMRQLRYPERQTATVRFSLRDDILGYGEFTSEISEAKFRSFIENNRTLGDNTDNRDLQFEFTLDIADEALFPAHPNIKIESLSLNLVSTAARSVRGDNNMAPALVDLVLLDRAFVRTFFAEYLRDKCDLPGEIRHFHRPGPKLIGPAEICTRIRDWKP